MGPDWHVSIRDFELGKTHPAQSRWGDHGSLCAHTMSMLAEVTQCGTWSPASQAGQGFSLYHAHGLFPTSEDQEGWGGGIALAQWCCLPSRTCCRAMGSSCPPFAILPNPHTESTAGGKACPAQSISCPVHSAVVRAHPRAGVHPTHARPAQLPRYRQVYCLRTKRLGVNAWEPQPPTTRSGRAGEPQPAAGPFGPPPAFPLPS